MACLTWLSTETLSSRKTKLDAFPTTGRFVESSASTPSDFKFEVQQILESMEAFIRSAIAEPFARPGVELLRDSVAVALRDSRLAGPFR